MAEFNLHVSIDPEALGADSLESYLDEYIDESQKVAFADVDAPQADDDTLDETLEIEGIDGFASLYTELRDNDDPLELGLWGPTAERFPVPVQHYALQQISNPDAYEFHAVDNKVTLVVADQQQQLQQLRQEVPPPALG
ncbi:hypothetical protein SAMN05216226_103107 [Halovenus aranensis]|jgi:hypothetical protein|uniref:Uncharacterized protein n=1 Tax=Halovenus aranensis TaxID=890420 RepID=A0A1G8TJH8_9EURY|nr:hypothetical protein [Halovenus aranensis]SDJ41746.1 hypothetical protein SAMN05216226_103107 [Halovenus aranensis]